MFRLDKILSDLTKLQRSRDKKSASPLGSPFFCQAILSHFLVCLVSQNPLTPSNARTGMASCYFKSAPNWKEIQCNKHTWTEKISFAFRTKISIFSGFKEQLALSRTCNYWQMNREQRGSSFNYYGSQFFHARSQTKNKAQDLFHPNLLLLLPMPLQLLPWIRNSTKH